MIEQRNATANARGEMRNRNPVVAIIGPFPNQTVVGIVLVAEKNFFVRCRHQQSITGFSGGLQGPSVEIKQNFQSVDFDSFFYRSLAELMMVRAFFRCFSWYHARWVEHSPTSGVGGSLGP